MDAPEPLDLAAVTPPKPGLQGRTPPCSPAFWVAGVGGLGMEMGRSIAAGCSLPAAGPLSAPSDQSKRATAEQNAALGARFRGRNRG